MFPKESTIRALIERWNRHYSTVLGIKSATERSERIAHDLYLVRNAGFGGVSPPPNLPGNLVDKDDEIMACVEHYFLTRDWVANGKYPAWEARTLSGIYHLGKRIGVAPRHNKAKPVTSASPLQRALQLEGIKDGTIDRKLAGIQSPLVRKPPKY